MGRNAGGTIAAFALLLVAMPSGPARGDTDLAKYPVPRDYHADGRGCYVPDRPMAAVTAPPIRASDVLAPRVPPATVTETSGGITRASTSGQDELTYRVGRASSFVQQHDVSAAIREYRLAAAAPASAGAQPSYHDLLTRLPLSVLLYRSGDVSGARIEWRTMLQNRLNVPRDDRAVLPQPPSSELLTQRRLDLLAARAVPDWNGMFFTSGAGQHMVRGTKLAQQHRVADAVAEWRTAVRCDARFQPPHLMLGYAAAIAGDRDAARREWLAALEGIAMSPGDMMGITNWQFDAMSALLQDAGT